MCGKEGKGRGFVLAGWLGLGTAVLSMHLAFLSIYLCGLLPVYLVWFVWLMLSNPRTPSVPFPREIMKLVFIASQPSPAVHVDWLFKLLYSTHAIKEFARVEVLAIVNRRVALRCIFFFLSC